jgi:hypothetical protein
MFHRTPSSLTLKQCQRPPRRSKGKFFGLSEWCNVFCGLIWRCDLDTESCDFQSLGDSMCWLLYMSILVRMIFPRSGWWADIICSLKHDSLRAIGMHYFATSRAELVLIHSAVSQTESPLRFATVCAMPSAIKVLQEYTRQLAIEDFIPFTSILHSSNDPATDSPPAQPSSATQPQYPSSQKAPTSNEKD